MDHGRRECSTREIHGRKSVASCRRGEHLAVRPVAEPNEPVEIETCVLVPRNLSVDLIIVVSQDQEAKVADRGEERARVRGLDSVGPSDERMRKELESGSGPGDPLADHHFVAGADGDKITGKCDGIDRVRRGLNRSHAARVIGSSPGQEEQPTVLTGEAKIARPGAFADPTDIQARNLVERLFNVVHGQNRSAQVLETTFDVGHAGKRLPLLILRVYRNEAGSGVLAPSGHGRRPWFPCNSVRFYDTPRRTPPRRRSCSFPRSPWECRVRRSASSAEAIGRGSVPDGIPTRSVGTRLETRRLTSPVRQVHHPVNAYHLPIAQHFTCNHNPPPAA